MRSVCLSVTPLTPPSAPCRVYLSVCVCIQLLLLLCLFSLSVILFTMSCMQQEKLDSVETQTSEIFII